MNTWLMKAVFCAKVKIASNNWKTQRRHRNLVLLSPWNILQQFPFTCTTKQGQSTAYFSKGSVIFAKFLWKRKAWMSCVSILGGRSPCSPSICRSCNVKAIPWKQERWEIISSSSSSIYIYNVYLPFQTIRCILFSQQVPEQAGLDVFASAGVLLILWGYSFWAPLFHSSQSLYPLQDFIFLCETGEQLRGPTADRLRFKSKITAASWIVSQEHTVDQEPSLVPTITDSNI